MQEHQQQWQEQRLQPQAAAAVVVPSAASQPAPDAPQLALQLVVPLSLGLQLSSGSSTQLGGGPPAMAFAPLQGGRMPGSASIAAGAAQPDFDALSDVDALSASIFNSSTQSLPDAAQQPGPDAAQQQPWSDAEQQHPWTPQGQQEPWEGSGQEPWPQSQAQAQQQPWQSTNEQVTEAAKERLAAEDRTRRSASAAAMSISRPLPSSETHGGGGGVGSPDVFADLFGMTTLDDYGRIVHTTPQRPSGAPP